MLKSYISLSKRLSCRSNAFSSFSSIYTDQSKRIQLSKIVATIGPKSEQLPVLTQVVDAGMKIMRINFSHATYDEADLRIKNIALVAKANKNVNETDNLISIMLDTQGPEIRTGSFSGDGKEVEMKAGQHLTLSLDPTVRSQQTHNKIWISYDKLLETVSIGTSILLDDGAIEVKVNSIDNEKKEVLTTIQNNGVLGNKKGAY